MKMFASALVALFATAALANPTAAPTAPHAATAPTPAATATPEAHAAVVPGTATTAKAEKMTCLHQDKKTGKCMDKVVKKTH